MKLTNVSFPHPVLGIGDDISSKVTFASVPEVVTLEEDYLFAVKMELDNWDILRLIRNGKANYACEVSSATALYRKCFFSDQDDFLISIPKNLLAGRVNFQFFIYAKCNFPYKNQKFHPDYADMEFEIEEGDILAYIGEFAFDADIDLPKIHAIGSFMEIAKGENKKPQFELDNKKIIIRLPLNMFEQCRKNIHGNTNFANVIHSSLVLNALITALMNYNDYKGDKLWARTIEQRVANDPTFESYKDRLENLDFNECSSLALELLHNPYERMFTSLISLGVMEED